MVFSDRYGDGTMRLTVEQDVIFPNVPEANLEAMQQVCQPEPQAALQWSLYAPGRTYRSSPT